MNKKAHILIWKIAAFLLPVILFLSTYVYYDPFRVVRYYDNYEEDCFVALNRDFVGGEVYLKKYPAQKYNAFIFGNSRSLSYLCADWSIYIPGASPFHYDGSGESLKGVRDKIVFIDENGGQLDHAMLVLDDFLLSLTGPLPGPTSEPHPTVSKTSWISFQASYFRYYLSEFYFFKYIDYYYTRKFKPYMEDIIETRPVDYNPITNDFYVKIYDEEMEKDAQAYIRRHANAYPERDTVHLKYTNAVINKQQEEWLSDIKRILNKHHTNYKIVLSPVYDMHYFNRRDLAKLQSIFGKEHVYDFSGKNSYTRNQENYYESFHYRPCVARDIMKRIYQK
jgi:hypothetical protein